MEPYETDFPELEPQQSPESPNQPVQEEAPTQPVQEEAPNQTHPQSSAQADWDAFYQQKKKKKKPAGTGKKVLCAILILALVAAGCGITAACLNSYWRGQNANLTQSVAQLNQQIQDMQQQIQDNSFTGQGNSISGTPNTSPVGLTPGQLYAKCVGSVVAVSTDKGSGSGFILSEDGFIVTNYHVVEGGSIISVTTHDTQEHTAVLRGYDSANDVAVLKIEAEGLPAAKLGSSDDLIVGDQVAAIGNPLGELTSTLTVGYVSAKDRTITTEGTLLNMIQTDAAINSGNSGGPLFNMKGEVVGITTAKYSGTTTSGASIEGIGFAIPMDDIVKKISDLVEFGYITGAYLGVQVKNMDPATVNQFGLPMGVYVQSVNTGSCAETAGVKAKDIITALGDTAVTDLNSLSRALQECKAGQTSTITVWRGGTVHTLPITFDEKPQTTAQPNTPPETEATLPDFWDPFFGN